MKKIINLIQILLFLLAILGIVVAFFYVPKFSFWQYQRAQDYLLPAIKVSALADIYVVSQIMVCLQYYLVDNLYQYRTIKRLNWIQRVLLVNSLVIFLLTFLVHDLLVLQLLFILFSLFLLTGASVAYLLKQLIKQTIAYKEEVELTI